MKCQCKELKSVIERIWISRLDGPQDADENLDFLIREVYKLAHKYDIKKTKPVNKIYNKNWRNIWRRFKELTTFNSYDWKEQQTFIQSYVGDEFRARLNWIDIWKEFDEKLNKLELTSRSLDGFNVSWITQQKLIRKLVEKQKPFVQC